MTRESPKKRQPLNKMKNTELKRHKHSDSDSDSNHSESDGEMDVNEFRKYVQKIFPSKHMENKIKAGDTLKQLQKQKQKQKHISKHKQPMKSKKEIKSSNDDDDIWGTDSEEEDVKEKVSKKGRRRETDEDISLGSEDTYEDEEDYDDDYDDEEEEEEDDEEEYDEEEYDEDDKEDAKDKKSKRGKSKLNIILTIGANEDDDDEWEDYDDEDYDDEDSNDRESSETEDEDVEVSTDEDEDENTVEDDDEEPEKNNKKKNNDNKNNANKNGGNKDLENDEILKKLKEVMELYPTDKSIQKCIQSYEENVQLEHKKREKKEKKQKAKNMRIFKKILTDKNVLNDFTFYEKLETADQKKMIKEMREINKIARIEKPYRMTLLESTIPVQFKAAAFKRINTLRFMEPRSGEYYKLKQWVDTFMKIPFTNYQSLPITIDNGVDSCHDFMENAQKTLDNAVYGLNDAKMQIMQMLGQFITNPKAVGTAIAIHGPPGTGKTSLVKEGISKILNRPFSFIALGGATDSSFLEGHSYTYEGSSWGKIVQILIDSNCMNPVIYFDELDKISDTPRGEEITGILTHLTDTTQNSEFHDKFFTEVNFDLSKCLFIFSYNDENKVNSILKDRMYRIKTKGYSNKEKTVIAHNYLLPKIREQVRFKEEDIIIPDEVIGYINDTHCNKEDGVRNLKRCLEIIHTKLNLYRLMKPGSNLFEGEMSLKVEFPFKITKDIVDKLIKKEEQNMSALYSMYV